MHSLTNGVDDARFVFFGMYWPNNCFPHRRNEHCDQIFQPTVVDVNIYAWDW